MKASEQNHSPSSTGPTDRSIAPWLRRELLLAGIFVPAGLVLMPPAIFMTGQTLLGAYSEGGHGMGHLYGTIFGDLARGFLPAWILVLSPWLGIQLLRLAAIPLRRRSAPERGSDA